MPKHPGRSPSVPRETTRPLISHHSDANFRTWTGRPGDAPLRRVANLNDEGCTHNGKTAESQGWRCLFGRVLHKRHERFSAFVNHTRGAPTRRRSKDISGDITVICIALSKRADCPRRVARSRALQAAIHTCRLPPLMRRAVRGTAPLRDSRVFSGPAWNRFRIELAAGPKSGGEDGIRTHDTDFSV